MKFNTSRIIRDCTWLNEPWVYIHGKFYVESRYSGTLVSNISPLELTAENSFIPFEFYYGDHVKVEEEGDGYEV